MKFNYVYAGALAILGLTFAVPAAQAQTVLTAFNFNDKNSFLSSSSGASSTLAFTAKGNTTIFGDTGTGTRKNAVSNDIAGNAGIISGGTSGNGSYLTFSLNATNDTVSNLSFAIMSSQQGFGRSSSSPDQFEYSTDGGGTFIGLTDLSRVTQSYSTQTVIFGGVTGLDHNAKDEFRLIFNGANGTNGTSTIDNLVLRGKTVSAAPEPSQAAGLAFFVLGLAGLTLRARKRAAAAV